MTESAPADSGSLLPVAVDVMGGDRGPEEVVIGAYTAAQELKIPVTLVGDQKAIAAALAQREPLSEGLLQIRHASEVVTMDDIPSKAVRSKTDSSMRVAYELVKEGAASAVVSPGNTGAMMATGVFVSGTLPGIGRPAIASLIPKMSSALPAVLLDSGANIDCHAHQLVQFALMGHFYARLALGCERPRLALLSNGTESSKGNDIIRSAALTLSELKEINFKGYVEGQDIPKDLVDVIVCDGFVGNIVLKAMEGSIELVFESVRQYIERNGKGRLGLWLVKPMLKDLFHEKLDPSTYGGAPLLGLNDVAIVCHGAAERRAICNGVKLAHRLCRQGLVRCLKQAFGSLDLSGEVYEDGLWNRVGQQLERGRKRRLRGLRLRRRKAAVEDKGGQHD